MYPPSCPLDSENAVEKWYKTTERRRIEWFLPLRTVWQTPVLHEHDGATVPRSDQRLLSCKKARRDATIDVVPALQRCYVSARATSRSRDSLLYSFFYITRQITYISIIRTGTCTGKDGAVNANNRRMLGIRRTYRAVEFLDAWRGVTGASGGKTGISIVSR